MSFLGISSCCKVAKEKKIKFQNIKKRKGKGTQKEHGVWESSGIDQIKKIKRGHEQCKVRVAGNVHSYTTSVDYSSLFALCMIIVPKEIYLSRIMY